MIVQISRVSRLVVVLLSSAACIGCLAAARTESALAADSAGCGQWSNDNPVLNVQLFAGGWPAGSEITLDPRIRVEVTTNASFIACDRKVDGTSRFSRITVRADRGLFLRGYDIVATKSLRGTTIEAGKVNVFNLTLSKAQMTKVRALQRLKGVRGVSVFADVVGPPYLGTRLFMHDPTAAFSGGSFSK